MIIIIITRIKTKSVFTSLALRSCLRACERARVRKSESLSSFFFLNFVLVRGCLFFFIFRVSIFNFFLVSFFPPFLFKNNDTLQCV